ncbi:unnamed protein product [Meloidogyne enterolobii]|uniref:Uncharacterized protein n=1 Tax=Meloidogyne enterolobii TaxID=390850 RepID=A0ACB0XZ89_MELEN
MVVVEWLGFWPWSLFDRGSNPSPVYIFLFSIFSIYFCFKNILAIILILKKFFQQISNLYPIIFSLVRCHEFRFLAILREEINATVKNSTKQIVKAQILTHLDADTIGYNPTTLSEHICKLTSFQWDATLLAVVNCLIILCNKIKSIQQLIIKCADQAALEESEQLQKQQQQKSRSDSINKSSAQNSGTSTPSIGNSVGSSIPLGFSLFVFLVFNNERGGIY